MRCEKDWRTLICYAGSASEASIGSKPLGSELDGDMGRMPGKSQEFLGFSKLRFLPAYDGQLGFSLQHTEIVMASPRSFSPDATEAEVA